MLANVGSRVKSAMTPDKTYGKNVEKIRERADDVASSTVVYAGDEWPLSGGCFVNFADVAKLARLFSAP